MDKQAPQHAQGPIPPVPAPQHAAAPASPDAPAAGALTGADAEAYDKLRARRAETRRKKLIRRGIAVGVAVVLIAVIAGAVALLNRPEEREATPITDMASTGSYVDSIDAEGKLKALEATVVTPEVDGTVASVAVSEGQQVKRGDELLTIKNDDLDRAVTDAERTLRDAKAQQKAAYDAYNAEVRAYNAAINQPTTAEDDAEPTEPTEPDESALTAADSAFESAQAALEAAQEQAAKRTVTAPISGSVIAMNAQPGASASGTGEGSSGLMQIADLSKMRVTVQVGERDIARVKRGQKAQVTFPAYEDVTFEGKVTSIASMATEGGDAYSYDGSDSVTFSVDILIEKPDSRLKPGMTANVSIVTEQIDNVSLVPTTALMTEDGQSYYVNVVTDVETYATVRREVQVLAQNDSQAAVIAPDAVYDAKKGTVTGEPPLADGEELLISGGTDEMMDGAASDAANMVS